jgi:DNA-binding MarR family transcriptional regulator
VTELATRKTSTRPSQAVTSVADTFVRLTRVFSRARARMLAAAASDVEWSAHVVLRQLSLEGPMRAASLADALQSDPSTVSRQVAPLVQRGLLERRADPDDGRASLLVLTDKGKALMAEHEEVRLARFAEMLSGWTEAEQHHFAELLARFTTAYETASGTWIQDRVNDRPATRSAH